MSKEEMIKKTEEIEELRKRLESGGGAESHAKIHASGKMTARERISYLCDSGSFEEFDLFARCMGKEYGLDKKDVPADGVITGIGNVNGRKAVIFSEDFSVIAGTFGEMHGRKICKAVEMAQRYRLPLIGMNDSGGARVQEEMGALSQYGQLFFRQVRASGVVPQIALIMGPVAGGQAYSPGMMDFLFMVEKTSYMFLAGPPLVKAIVFEEIDNESLGGPDIHARISGVSDMTTKNDKHCLDTTKKLLSYLPSHNGEKAPYVNTGDKVDRCEEKLVDVIPTEAKLPYDMHNVIDLIVDNGEFFELKKDFAMNLIVGFARLNGHAVGVVANNPLFMAGCLDANAADKGSRFIRFCNAFNIPLVNLQDVPGFLIGSRVERFGGIRHGSKMLFSYAEATVPKLTVVLRKSYAGGYLAMCSKDVGADFVFALPTAEICLMGPPGAVTLLFGKEIAAAADPKAERAKREKEFYDKYVNPTYAAGLQHVDDIIDPRRIRPKLIHALEATLNKVDSLPAKKSGNYPT